MIIQHNLLASFTDRQLGINNTNKSKSTEKLSTGYRINRSADDAAGLSISEKMRAQIRGLDQASVNIQDGLSLLQTGDGALHEIHFILQRLGELSVQAANDTYTQEDRTKINDEFNTLKREINRITSQTEFNTYPIFIDDDLPIGGIPADIQIYSTSPGNYGGLIYDGVRYDWNQIKSSDGTYSLANNNPNGGTYYLNTVDGQTLSFSMDKGATIPNISKQYMIEASVDSIKIDGTTHYWGSVRDANDIPINTSNPRSGEYYLNHHGSIIELYVDEGDNLEDIITKLNNSKKLSPSWESQIINIPVGLAVSVGEDAHDYAIKNSIKNSVIDGSYTVVADASGIHLSGYDTVPWSDLKFTPPFYNGNSQGIDFSTGAGIGAGTYITFQCPNTGIAFEFNINEESSMNEVINGLNGIVFAGNINSPLDSNMALSNTPSVMDSINSVTDIIIPFEKQRDELNIDFENMSWTTSSGFSDYSIVVPPTGNYPLSISEITKLDHFFRNGTDTSIQLTFGDSVDDSISISFDRVDNMTDLNRPKPGDYTVPADYQAALDIYVTGMMDNFKAQLSSSSFSLRSSGAILSTGYISERSMAQGNTANTPIFGVKPKESYRIKDIQAGANAEQNIELEISKLSTSKLGLIGTKLTSHHSASEAITSVYNAIDKISTERSKLGAYSNRLEHAMANSYNMSENLQRAEGIIRDTNMADEMIQYSKQYILEQASQSLLAQANKNPQSILILLQ